MMRGRGGEAIELTRPLLQSGAGRTRRAPGGTGPTLPAGSPAGSGETATRRTSRRERGRTAKAGTVGGDPLNTLLDQSVADECSLGWIQTRQGQISAAEMQRSREKEPLTGMAQAPGSKLALTTGSGGRWKQRARETERGDGERGKPWCSIHQFDTTKPFAKSCDRRRAHANRCGKRSSLRRHHAGNGGHERRTPTGDRGRRDDKTDERDVGHAGRHAHGKPRTSVLVHQETGANSEHDRSNETEKSATPETSLLETEGM
jgi:hypothetical protein